MAIPYVKQTWTDGSGGGTPISAARLGVIEQGIFDAHSKIPAVAVTAAAPSIPDNTLTIVRYDTVIEDNGSDITTGAAWKYTAPNAGIYSVCAAVLYASSAGWSGTEIATLYLYKNGALYRTLDYKAISTATQLVHVGGAAMVRLAVNDTIDIRTLQNSGAAISLFASADANYADICMISG